MAVRDDFSAGEVLAAADLNDTFASKVDYATPTNAQTGTTYTFVAADAEKLTTASNASPVTLTIPPQSSVTWPDNTILRVVNYGAGAVSVAGGSGVTVTNTATTLAQYESAAAIRTGSDAWTLVPFGGKAADIVSGGGDEIKVIGGYVYHLFENSGTFRVLQGSPSCEILLIGAGGGGGRRCGGGGGGGAIEPASGYTSQTLSVGTYSVTVAAGGAGSTNASVKGGTPSATTFAGTSTLSASGGGGGGSNLSASGATGGSGGGGAGDGSSGGAGGTASGNNTNSGGQGASAAGGGGGGADAAGANAPAATTGGNGGAGLTLTDIDPNLTAANFALFAGMTVVSSGGGGGVFGATSPVGTAGTGGTGAGDGSNTSAVDGGDATSYGSGGGGSYGTDTLTESNGGDGYDGLVIVRYAA